MEIKGIQYQVKISNTHGGLKTWMIIWPSTKTEKIFDGISKLLPRRVYIIKN
jgi:hypothetical protein